jgi:hypothetical protein
MDVGEAVTLSPAHADLMQSGGDGAPEAGVTSVAVDRLEVILTLAMETRSDASLV